MRLRSKYLKEFIEEITYKNRNPKNLKALELLDDKETNPTIELLVNEEIYRARLITKSDREKVGNKDNYYGFDASGSYVAPKEYTRDMRANYRYIPYLYCANHAYLAVIEVRPRLGAEVSVATIQVKESITLLDFTMRNTPKKMTEAKKNLFKDLSNLYSVPVTEDDDITDYIPTQYIAEYAKNLGYDGIAFSSSLMPEGINVDSSVYNVVIFRYEKAAPIKSNVVRVVENNLELAQIDTDNTKIDLNR